MGDDNPIVAAVIVIIVILGILAWNAMAQDDCDARGGSIVLDRGPNGAVGTCVEPQP